MTWCRGAWRAVLCGFGFFCATGARDNIPFHAVRSGRTQPLFDSTFFHKFARRIRGVVSWTCLCRQGRPNRANVSCLARGPLAAAAIRSGWAHGLIDSLLHGNVAACVHRVVPLSEALWQHTARPAEGPLCASGLACCRRKTI